MKLFSDLFLWTVTTSASAAVVAGMVWLLVRLAGRAWPPRAHYWLWTLVVIRLLLPVVPARGWSPFNVWVHLGASTPTSAQALPQLTETPAIPTRAPLAPVDAASVLKETTSDREAGPVRASVDWRKVAAILWLTGALIYLCLMVGKHLRFARRMRQAELIRDPQILAVLAEAQAALNVARAVALVQTDATECPAVFGIFRPKLLLPCGTLDRLTKAELRHVLMHELVHLRRRDVLLNWIWIVLQAWHWFNPMLGLAFRRLRAEREVICDAAVLAKLRPTDRPAYGATLLHVAALMTQHPFPSAATPGLATVLDFQRDRQLNLERRIRMISNYRPATWQTTVVTGVFVAVLGGVLFTRAADKKTPPPAEPTAVQPGVPAPVPAPETAARNRSIEGLEQEVAKMERLVREHQTRLNDWRAQLQISAEGEERTGAGAPKTDLLQRLQSEQISAQTEHARMASLHRSFTNMTRADLRLALPNAFPDPLLTRLFEEQALTEQKLAQISEIQGKDAPERRSMDRVLETIARQIDERMAGILRGMEVRLQSDRERAESLAKALEEARSREVRAAIERTPYYDAKRELENLYFLLERLRARLLQEKLDARLLDH